MMSAGLGVVRPSVMTKNCQAPKQMAVGHVLAMVRKQRQKQPKTAALPSTGVVL